MPHLVDPHNTDSQKQLSELYTAEYQYDYPMDKDLKPGSEFHDKLLKRVKQRADDSKTIMSRRYSDWNEIDRIMRTYVKPEVAEGKDSGRKKSATKVTPDVVIPQSFATHETILTYLSSAFFQDPIWTYDGVGPEDQLGAMLMTHVIDQQVKRNSMGLNLHTQWSDSLKYGIGIISPVWETKYGSKQVVRESGFMNQLKGLFIKTGEERGIEEDVIIREGNKLLNIDPYSYFPDPSVSAENIQDAEFCGWIEETNMMSLMRRDQDEKDFVFNGKYVRHTDGRSDLKMTKGSQRVNDGRNNRIASNNPLHILWMYIDLIPNDWGLGPSTTPQVFLFGIAADKVIVAMQPLNLTHGLKPIAVAAPDYDGYTSNPTSRLMTIADLQNLIDFLYSSHIQNVRKAINDMFVIDPSIINYHDVANPEPGKLIRMRRAGWGKGLLRDAITQFPVQDVTQNHVQDTMFLSDIMQQVTSANDFMSGKMPHRTSRVSAAEVNRVSGSSMSRLEKMARIISMQSMMPIGHMLASHTQQFMQEDTYIKIAGKLEEDIRDTFGEDVEKGRMKASPLDMIVDYDVMPHDGTIPKKDNVQDWVQLMQVAGSSEMIAPQLNFVNLFRHIARQMGAKNVDDFIQKPPPQVTPDEEVQKQAQAGNLVPTNNV